LRNLSERYGGQACVVRISDVYGPKFSQGNLLRAFLARAAAGLPLEVYGGGRRARDYIHVDDAADGITFLWEKRAAGTYNLSTGAGTSILEMAKIFSKLSGGKSSITFHDVENEDRSEIILDNSKLRALGFEPKIRIEEGVGLLLDAYRKEPW
jgi:nucleoside-diphosphate-sugar epimerase